MSNVFRLRRLTGSDHPASNAFTAQCPIPVARRITDIQASQAKLKETIREGIFMLDLAVAKARIISDTTSDPALKMQVDSYLDTVGELVELARQNASKL